MNGDRLAEAIFLGLALMMPLSALIARRNSLTRVTRLAMLWAAIIVGAALLVGLARSREGLGAMLDGGSRGAEQATSDGRDRTLIPSHVLHNICYQDE